MDESLGPLVESLAKQAIAQMPTVTDYIPELATLNVCATTYAEFDRQTAHVKDQDALREARKKLTEQLDTAWEQVEIANDAFGKQTLEVVQEEQEIVKDEKRVHIKDSIFFESVPVFKKMVRTEVRETNILKNGTREPGAWRPMSSKTVVGPAAFDELENVPQMEGIMRMRDKDGFTSFIMGTPFREMYCWLGDGHLVWWDRFPMVRGKACPSGESIGALSFLLNRAEVQEEGEDEFCFCLAPMQISGEEAPSWSDHSGFVDPVQGAFIFSTKGCVRDCNEWKDALRANIAFAQKAVKDLGEPSVIKEIGTGQNIRKRAKQLSLQGEAKPALQTGSTNGGFLGLANMACCGPRPGRGSQPVTMLPSSAQPQ